MLRGDLRSTPLAPLLFQLANDAATGCLQILDGGGDEALLYLKSGLIYAVVVPGTRPQLGAKLVSSGAIAPEALADALQAQRTELQGWRLGELLVHLGYVEQPVVEAFIREQVRDALWDLLLWPGETWKFRKNIKAREDVGPPLAVVDLLETLRERGYEWETISAVLHGPTAVPRLSTRGDSDPETVLDNDAWSMLCKIDGERSVGDLARDCGYTMFEAGQVIVALVQAGLVDIDEDVDLAGSAPYGASTLSSALAGGIIDVHDTVDDDEADEADDALSRLARLVSEVAGEHVNGEAGSAHDGVDGDAEPTRSGSYDGSMTVRIPVGSEESFALSIARVSSALSVVLGDQAPTTDPAVGVRAPRPRPVSIDDPEWDRRQRAAAAAELATAQAMIESLRDGHDPSEPAAELTDEVPKVVNAEVERERVAAREAEEAERRAAEEATRLAAEQFARAAAEEAERVAAEQAAQQLATEQAAEQEAARLAAEAEQAERAAAERAELETQAWAEYWEREDAERQAAEQAAEQEAARLAAEAEAAAAEEAERLAAAEAARLAAEAEAAEETARLAAEAEAEAAAAAEAERAAAEEAERLAEEAAAAAEAEAEAAAAAEAERVAAEQAAQQAAAEQAEEAEREAAEEAARLAADAARQAEEAETAAAADAEAERVAAEKAAVRAAAKAERAAQRKAQKLAAEEAARHADHAAATALLVELAMEVEPPDAQATPEPDATDTTDATDATDTADTADQAEPSDAGANDGSGDDTVEETAGLNGSGRALSDAETTDTAALLRELSSLGIEEDRRPVDPTPPRAPRPTATPEKKPKKKIGLFGR